MNAGPVGANIVRAFVAVIGAGLIVVGVLALLVDTGVIGAGVAIVAVSCRVAFTFTSCRVRAGSSCADVVGAIVAIIGAASVQGEMRTGTVHANICCTFVVVVLAWNGIDLIEAIPSDVANVVRASI
jgi:hypothetical protein